MKSAVNDVVAPARILVSYAIGGVAITCRLYGVANLLEEDTTVYKMLSLQR